MSISLDLILSASIRVVAILAYSSELEASAQSYSKVVCRDFCALNFDVHEVDPSAGTVKG
jgi:hypothetical protein